MPSSKVLPTSILASAVRFVDCFPEAEIFDVLLLTEEKAKIIYEPKCTKQRLLTQLPDWLKLQSLHFFIRPLVGNLVLVDLDNYRGDLELVLRLKPRALTSTSPGNYQAWFMLPATLATKTALWVTKQLTQTLHGDKCCVKEGQHGRLPGGFAHEVRGLVCTHPLVLARSVVGLLSDVVLTTPLHELRTQHLTLLIIIKAI